jgi:ribosomal protein S18 acetylase RimI-like enzyme
MITPNPGSAYLRAKVTWMDRRVDLAQVLSINAHNELDVWSLDTFDQHLNERYVIGKVARHEDDVVGYMIYRLHKDHIDVLKIEADPDYRGRGIMEQLIEHLAHQLSPTRRKEIVFHIPEDDIETLDIMEKCGLGESGIQSGYFRGGGNAYEMRYHVQKGGFGSPLTKRESPWQASECDFEGATDPRPSAGAARARHRPDGPSARALPDGLSNARRRLTELTHAEWDVVKPHRRAGQFVTVDTASDLEGVDPSDIYFRTVSKLVDPAAACDALHAFCRIPTKRTHADRSDKPAQIVIPSTWLLRLARRRPDSGSPGQLRAAFKPADPYARSVPEATRRTRRPNRPIEDSRA